MALVLGSGGAPVAAQVRTPMQSALRPVAILTVISGDVLARSAGGTFSSAADGAELYVRSTIRTGADARAVITLFEGSTVELEPASDITIEEATLRSGSTIVQLAQSLGRSWHVVTHLTTADSRYEVRTPAATASVRGTAFEVAVVDGASGPTTTVTTTEGLVAAADVAATGEVLVIPDQTTTVHANSAPEPPRSAPEAQRVVTVTALSESSIVVDPLGRANGFKDGRVLAQTPSARVRIESGTIVVTLPNVPDGVFTTTVAASTGAPAPVSTTVTDRGEEPVTVTTAAEAGSGSTTTGVEVRKSRDKPVLRALSADEMKRLSEAKAGLKRANDRATAKPSPRAATTNKPGPRATSSQVNKTTTGRLRPPSTPRTAPTSPSPTRR